MIRSIDWRLSDNFHSPRLFKFEIIRIELFVGTRRQTVVYKLWAESYILTSAIFSLVNGRISSFDMSFCHWCAFMNFVTSIISLPGLKSHAKPTSSCNIFYESESKGKMAVLADSARFSQVKLDGPYQEVWFRSSEGSWVKLDGSTQKLYSPVYFQSNRHLKRNVYFWHRSLSTS